MNLPADTAAFDLIVFDWDGTLMDSTVHITRSIQRACADLGLPVPERSRASHVIGLGLVDAMRHVCPGLPAERYQDMVNAYRTHYLAGDQAIELFDGVAEVVNLQPLSRAQALHTLVDVVGGDAQRVLKCVHTQTLPQKPRQHQHRLGIG